MFPVGDSGHRSPASSNNVEEAVPEETAMSIENPPPPLEQSAAGASECNEEAGPAATAPMAMAIEKPSGSGATQVESQPPVAQVDPPTDADETFESLPSEAGSSAPIDEDEVAVEEEQEFAEEQPDMQMADNENDDEVDHFDESPQFDPLMNEALLDSDGEMIDGPGGANLNLMAINNYDDGSNGAVLRPNQRHIYIPVNHVHAAIRELISQGRRSNVDANVAPVLIRDNFMQRIRSLMFRYDHDRQRNRGGGEGNPDMDVENDDDNGDGNDEEVEEHVEEEEPENPIRFDTSLPAEHSYMGTSMNRVSGVDYLDVGVRHSMMLFMHQHVLFPGEVLPFMISGSIIESDIDSENGLLFGVCFPFLRGGEEDENIYGVTCHVYEKGSDERGNTLIKSRALQRFIANRSVLTGPLQFITAHPQLKCHGYVRVLPEIFLPEPLKCIDMGSMNRFRDNASMQQSYKRYQASSTPWPAHIYDHYSIAAVVEKARTQLAQHKIETMPTDPTQLSFWLVRNLHLSESMVKTIFMTDSVNTRFKLISSTFKEDSIFSCRYCGNRIANCRELFAMSKHGVQTQYCNSAGYIHETNTVYQLLRDAITYSGEPSSEFSWFPGYQWHIIVCKICSRHIGWQFKAVEPNLVPKSFFGISSSSVRISGSMHVPTDSPRAVIYRSFMRLARRQMQ